jgi:hypothetical protein
MNVLEHMLLLNSIRQDLNRMLDDDFAAVVAAYNEYWTRGDHPDDAAMLEPDENPDIDAINKRWHRVFDLHGTRGLKSLLDYMNNDRTRRG